MIYAKLDEKVITRFITTRHSIRSFSSDRVSDNVMENVLKLSFFAPSACNRQPIKVYWTSNQEKVREIDGCIPRNKGFGNQILNYEITGVDRNMFGKNEILEWYVNGEIYISYFVMALHTYKLGSCIFQMPIIYGKLSRIYHVEGIPDNFAIICAIGFGYPKEEVK